MRKPTQNHLNSLNLSNIRVKNKTRKIKRKFSGPNVKTRFVYRNRTNQTFILQKFSKTNETIDLLGCSFDFFKKCIKVQLAGVMRLDNYG